MSSSTRPPAFWAALGAAVVGAPVLGAAGVAGAPPAQAAPPADPGTHLVREGETLSGIAASSGTSVDALAAANGIPDPGLIQVGQRLAVPAPGAAATAPAPAPGTGGGDPPQEVVVAPGDTLSGIAARTGTTVDALVSANGISTPSLIRPGQRFVVPAPGTTATAPPPTAPPPTGGATPAAAPTGAPTTTVQPGDTLTAIAARAGVSLSALLASSGLEPRALLHAGQVVTLPTPPTAPQAPVASTFEGRTYAPEVTAAATANRDALAAAPAPSREQVQELITATALQMGVEPALALAVAHQESGFNARAVSPANAVGAMQVIPASGRWASALVGRDLDLLDATDNATAGVAILRALLRATEGDEATALAGYYQGLKSVRDRGVFDDTRRYVANVQTLAARYRGV